MMQAARTLIIILIGILIFSAGYAGVAGGGRFLFPEENFTLPADWFFCELKGATISAAMDKQTITLDLRKAGGTVDLYSHRIVFKNKGIQVIIETEEALNPINNMVSGTVKNATIKTDPIFGESKKIGGKFLVMFETTYSHAPPSSSGIKVTLSEAPTSDMMQQFQDGAKQQGFEIGRIAYIMDIRTLNISPSNPVKLTMSVSPGWVNSNAGRNAVHMMRLADDGTIEILETESEGYDQFGNYLFSADSPHGFSTFGLVSAIKISTAISDAVPSKVSGSSVESPSALLLFVPALFILLVGVYLYPLFQSRNKG